MKLLVLILFLCSICTGYSAPKVVHEIEGHHLLKINIAVEEAKKHFVFVENTIIELVDFGYYYAVLFRDPKALGREGAGGPVKEFEVVIDKKSNAIKRANFSR